MEGLGLVDLRRRVSSLNAFSSKLSIETWDDFLTQKLSDTLPHQPIQSRDYVIRLRLSQHVLPFYEKQRKMNLSQADARLGRCQRF